MEKSCLASFSGSTFGCFNCILNWLSLHQENIHNKKLLSENMDTSFFLSNSPSIIFELSMNRIIIFVMTCLSSQKTKIQKLAKTKDWWTIDGIQAVRCLTFKPFLIELKRKKKKRKRGEKNNYLELFRGAWFRRIREENGININDMGIVSIVMTSVVDI